MPKLNPDRRHQVSFHPQRQGDFHGSRVQNTALRCTASYRGRDRHARGLRAWHMRSLHSHRRRPAGPFLLDACSPGARLRHPHRRGTRTVSRPALGAASSLPPPSLSVVWLLYRRYPHVAARLLVSTSLRPSEEELKEIIGGHLCRCTGYAPILAAALEAAATLRRESLHV